MAPENTPPKRGPVGSYAARSARPAHSVQRRLAFRLIGLPVIAVIAVYLFNGLRGYVELPQCDSERAKQSLSDVLKQLKFEPLHDEPIKTVSSSKDEVVCNAVLPLSDGANVVADFTFYWQGNKANMRYSISRQAPKSS